MDNFSWIKNKNFIHWLLTCFESPKVNYFFLALLSIAIIYVASSRIDRYEQQLLQQYIGEKVEVVGTIDKIYRMPYGSTMRVKLNRLGQHRLYLATILIKWYGQSVPILWVGQTWRLRVKLTPLHHLKNNFQHNAPASGVQGRVVSSSTPMVLSTPPLMMQHLHYQLSQWLGHSLSSAPAFSFFSALCLGDREQMPHQVWAVFQRTGTSHLIAVSGLHIGLVAWFFYFIFNHLLKLIPWMVYLNRPRQHLALLFSVAMAWLFAHFSGWSLTTERASWMLFFSLLLLWFDRRMSLWSSLFFSIWVMMLLHMGLHWGPSIVLSMVAVFYLGFLIQPRLVKKIKSWEVLGLQWRLSLLLMPWTCYFFSYVSLVEVVTNIIAIPYVELLLAPVSLLACLVYPVSLKLANGLLFLAHQLFIPFWFVLSHLSAWQFILWVHPIHHLSILFVSVLGLLLLMAGWGVRFSILSVWMLIPIVTAHAVAPLYGQLDFHVFDVGQGLSTMVQTQHHQLLYDAGPRYPFGYDLGQKVVVPSLLYAGIDHLDMMIISHGDMDHRGGAKSILDFYPATPIYTSAPWYFKHADFCYRGQHWVWDGVDFSVLWPLQGKAYQGNNSSCVLQVKSAHQTLLLTGDMGFKVDRALLRQKDLDKIEVMLIPHHGSCYASSLPLVKVTRPQYAIVSSGFHNRYHMPCRQVVDRYQFYGANVINTANNGEVDLHLK